MTNETEIIISRNATGVPPDVNIDNLYPAIVQCFGIILAGYIAGRANIITGTNAKGIGTYVTKFCLPALLLKSMCFLDFTRVNWMFLLGILISKTTVFVIVCTITLIAKRPMSAGYAGLFAIFATQSNDFALGYPIVEALYKDTHPDYMNYIYLVAPISLCFLNPIGFMLMEIHSHRQSSQSTTGNCILLHVIKDVLTNPIIFMTVIGVVANFALNRHLPDVILYLLDVLGNAYSATALFYIGLTLVGKVQGQMGISLVVPSLLIGAKTILLPLITWQVVGAVEDSTDINGSLSEGMSMYGFLYGTFPTAPSVLLYASQYSVATDVIATGMVAGTFFSAPLMFVSAKMMTVVVNSELDYRALLLSTSNDISIASLISCVWVFGILFFSHRFRRIPHQFLVCLIISQTLSCIGMISYTGANVESTWRHYLQFIVLMVGILGSRCWTAILSLVLFLLHYRSLCFVLRIRVWLFLIGFGLPIFATGLLFLFGTHHMHDEIDPSFHYGVDQSLVSMVILLLCSIMNVVFLTMYQRTRRHQNDSLPTTTVSADSAESITKMRKSQPVASQNGSINAASDTCIHPYGDAENEICSKYSTTQNIEDIVPFPEETDSLISDSSHSSDSSCVDRIQEQTCRYGTCSTLQQRHCAGLLRTYNASSSVQVDAELEISQSASTSPSEYQTNRFIVLLIMLQLSMFIGLFLCTWRLFKKTTSGIYVEIEFLDSVFNFGQGLFILATFGFDTRLILIPFIKRWRRCIYGVEVVQIPDKSELVGETRQLCQQFTDYHRDSCAKAIVRDMKFRSRVYRCIFTGTDMCDWLIKVGLAKDRGEAAKYGRALTIGQIISHVTGEHHFHDMPYFYKFTTDEDHS